MIDVKFYVERDGSILAYFPNTPWNRESYRMMCYSTIGQHFGCSKEYIRPLRLADPLDFEDLKNELIAQGYTDLNVIDSRTAVIKIVSKVNCKHGAPMGRPNVGVKPLPSQKEVFRKKVPMAEDPAYDIGGAYWGLGKTLKVEFTKDLSYIKFYRDE